MCNTCNSLFSGPKRYDFAQGKWVYKYDGVTLHELLSTEISNLAKQKVNFSMCEYGGNLKNEGL